MNDIVMKKTKLGFSLMEACVVMLIASIFIVVMANVVPRKVSKKSMAEAHGRFECYWGLDKVLYQNEFNSGASVYGVKKASERGGGSSTIRGVSGAARDYCNFTPNRYAKYYIINAVGAGGLGDATVGPGAKGGNSGKFESTFTPAFTGSFRLYPGKYTAEANSTLSNSYVTDDTGKMILFALGADDSGFNSVNDIEDCQFVKVTNVDRYDCGITPSCSISNDRLLVSHCVNQEKYKATSFAMSDGDSMYCLKPGASIGKLYNHPFYVAYKDRPSGVNSGLDNCKYNTLKSNPWIYQPESGTLLYPDVELALPKPHNMMSQTWTPRTDSEKLPSLYTMRITRIVEAESANGAVSTMETMAKVFSFSNALKYFSAGSGGAAGKSVFDPPAEDGKGGPAPGSVVVTW